MAKIETLTANLKKLKEKQKTLNKQIADTEKKLEAEKKAAAKKTVAKKTTATKKTATKKKAAVKKAAPKM
jgi:predicted  nucleic acid-binding Zn-ribbon protein